MSVRVVCDRCGCEVAEGMNEFKVSGVTSGDVDKEG